MTHAHAPRRNDLDTLQSRFALRLAGRLTEQSERLPHDIGERLRVAREQAVRRAQSVRAAAMAKPRVSVVSVGPGTLALGSGSSWWVRIGSLLPLLLLVAGLLAIQQLHEQAEIRAAAEVDAALLADDLPPAAYGDPGFVEFLKHAEP